MSDTQATTIQHLIAEKINLKAVLYYYGDHTLECHRAPTEKCVCGWENKRRELGIKPREDR